jgi:hypothetical protein
MTYAVEVGSVGMIYLPSSMTICYGIEAKLRLLPQQFVRL